MPQAKKTQTEEENTRSDVMNDWMQVFTDPTNAIEAQRKIALSTFDGLLQAQKEARKVTEDALEHSAKQMDSWAKPFRQATEEMTAASFDLGQRALEASRGEVVRWYDTITPN